MRTISHHNRELQEFYARIEGMKDIDRNCLSKKKAKEERRYARAGSRDEFVCKKMEAANQAEWVLVTDKNRKYLVAKHDVYGCKILTSRYEFSAYNRQGTSGVELSAIVTSNAIERIGAVNLDGNREFFLIAK